jgi:cbb3-type cytochrome c oxidase subunit III
MDALANAAVDPAEGRRIYEQDCASCHGSHGEGTPVGSPLAAVDSRARELQVVYDALAGDRRAAGMPAYSIYGMSDMRSVIDHVRTLPLVAGVLRAGWTRSAGDAAAGEAVYARSCAGCHGAKGEGATGPALANGGFRRVATPAFVAATVARGRPGTPMPSFGRDSVGYGRLSAAEIADVTAFVTGRLGTVERAAARAPSAGSKN